jgi:hypothetical protein
MPAIPAIVGFGAGTAGTGSFGAGISGVAGAAGPREAKGEGAAGTLPHPAGGSGSPLGIPLGALGMLGVLGRGSPGNLGRPEPFDDEEPYP